MGIVEVLANAVVVYDPARGAATLVEPAPAKPIDADRPTVAVQLDPLTLAVGTSSGNILRIDASSGKTLGTIATLTSSIAALDARAGWLVALGADGALWRRDPHGAETHARFAGFTIATLGPTGVVYLARDDRVFAWSTGEPVEIARMRQPIGGTFRVLATGSLAAITRDGGVHVVDPVSRSVRTVLPASETVAFARDAPIAAATVGGGIVAADLDTGATWRLVDRLTCAREGLAISNDGLTLVAAEDMPPGATLHAWHLGFAMPPALWVQRATNARPPTTDRAAMVWEAP
jgi:hypothetical protein